MILCWKCLAKVATHDKTSGEWGKNTGALLQNQQGQLHYLLFISVSSRLPLLHVLLSKSVVLKLLWDSSHHQSEVQSCEKGSAINVADPARKKSLPMHQAHPFPEAHTQYMIPSPQTGTPSGVVRTPCSSFTCTVTEQGSYLLKFMKLLL